MNDFDELQKVFEGLKLIKTLSIIRIKINLNMAVKHISVNVIFQNCMICEIKLVYNTHQTNSQINYFLSQLS